MSEIISTSQNPSTPKHDQRDSSVPDPQFTSSLSYANVRDYAYPSNHPLHYGPAPIPSAAATPSTAGRNSGFLSGSGIGWFSNPHAAQEQGRRSSESSAPHRGYEDENDWQDPRAGHNHPPPLKFADGPPWFEDEDLASPVIISNRSRKHKSTLPTIPGRAMRDEKGRLLSVAESGTDERLDNALYHDGESLDPSLAPGDIGEPGGTYSTTTGEYISDELGEDEEEYEEGSEDEYAEDDSRFSKDYHFSIASPDEEMHGKAVALFDFTRENDNELGLLEGQVIWVSYRHGQGWLVAEDPKTGMFDFQNNDPSI